ncbi:hypothetical protein LY90DRAFT_678190 [Neocallimastix californiae]|uniref:PH domain-containing protein n=1 Tax=Neocallimastix californiae TaxID=1754190 RepID=A0A1Y1ZEC2_9FUNG|nr:hypothetical protein LY90DRAFT_678190 [Neocallimastix californiae]|eukprot:ORY08620.1 hypothetical protein LY90DRAFT_678190 [Neocallimastix californiae]
MMINDYNTNSVSSVSSYSSLSMDIEERKVNISSNFNSTKPPILPVGRSLKTLHLPPSIENIDNLPCGLWNWIHSQDFISQESASDLTTFQGSGTKVIFNNEKIVNGKLVQSKHVIMDNHENASLFEVVGKNVKNKNSSKCPLPRPLPPKKKSYLNSSQSLRGSDLSISRSMQNYYSKSSSIILNSLSSVTTKVDEPTTNSSLYIQAVELQGKFSSKISSIFCIVEVGKRKYKTEPVKVEKNSTSVEIREGFLFDVPSANFTANIKVYGIHPTHSKSVFSTLFKRGSSLLKNSSLKIATIRKSNETLTNSMEFNQIPKEKALEGTEVYLGEVSFQLTNIKFSKLTGTYPLLVSSSSTSSLNTKSLTSLKASKILKNSKKNTNKNANNIPNIVIQMGIYNEEQVKIEPPKIPSDVKNISLQYENFISFLINSNQKMIWRRYWAQILNSYIYIYDSEYRNKKNPITRLNLSFIKAIGKTDPEQNYIYNAETGEELIQNIKIVPLQFDYIDGNEILIEDLVKNNESWSNWNLNSLNDGFKIYCYADSKKDVLEWIEYINKAREINK